MAQGERSIGRPSLRWIKEGMRWRDSSYQTPCRSLPNTSRLFGPLRPEEERRTEHDAEPKESRGLGARGEVQKHIASRRLDRGANSGERRHDNRGIDRVRRPRCD